MFHKFEIDQDFVIIMTLIAAAFIIAWRMVSCAVSGGMHP